MTFKLNVWKLLYFQSRNSTSKGVFNQNSRTNNNIKEVLNPLQFDAKKNIFSL